LYVETKCDAFNHPFILVHDVEHFVAHMMCALRL